MEVWKYKRTNEVTSPCCMKCSVCAVCVLYTVRTYGRCTDATRAASNISASCAAPNTQFTVCIIIYSTGCIVIKSPTSKSNTITELVPVTVLCACMLFCSLIQAMLGSLPIQEMSLSQDAQVRKPRGSTETCAKKTDSTYFISFLLQKIFRTGVRVAKCELIYFGKCESCIRDSAWFPSIGLSLKLHHFSLCDVGLSDYLMLQDNFTSLSNAVILAKCFKARYSYAVGMRYHVMH